MIRLLKLALVVSLLVTYAVAQTNTKKVNVVPFPDCRPDNKCKVKEVHVPTQEEIDRVMRVIQEQEYNRLRGHIGPSHYFNSWRYLLPHGTIAQQIGKLAPWTGLGQGCETCDAGFNLGAQFGLSGGNVPPIKLVQEIPEWTAPTFEYVPPVIEPAAGPSVELVNFANKWAKENPWLENAKCNDCFPASKMFQEDAEAAGIKNLRLMRINSIDEEMRSSGTVSPPFAAMEHLGSGNPQLDYTGFTQHWVVVSEDGWAIDMSARQFPPAGLPGWLGLRKMPYPYIYPVVKNWFK